MLKELAQLIAGTDEQVWLTARSKRHGRERTRVREGCELQKSRVRRGMQRGGAQQGGSVVKGTVSKMDSRGFERC